MLIDNVDFKRTCLQCLSPCGEYAKFCRSCKRPLLSASDMAAHLRSSASSMRTLERSECAEGLADQQLLHIEQHAKHKLTFINDEPVFLLPNSYISCKAILRHIGKRLGIRRYGTGFRYYAVLARDGQPYALIINLIANHILCKECREEV